MLPDNFKNMSLKDLVKYITKTYHEPLRKDLIKLEKPMKILLDSYSEDFKEIKDLYELYIQFKKEILKHITKEDLVTFPTIISYEHYSKDKLFQLTDDPEVIGKMVKDTKMINDHVVFNSYLDNIINLISKSYINDKNIKEFIEVKNIFEKIYEDNKTHTILENGSLYKKGMELQDKLIEELQKIL